MDQIPNRCQCQLASSNINDFKSQNLDQASNGKDFDLYINNIFPKEYSQYNSFEIQHAYMVNKETLSIESTTSQRAQKRSRCSRDAPFMVSSKEISSTLRRSAIVPLEVVFCITMGSSVHGVKL